MLKTFLQSYKKSLPQVYGKLIKRLQIHPTLIVHQPVIVIPSVHPTTIKLKIPYNSHSIPPNVSILMLSASQSFTNIQLFGATNKDKSQVDIFFNQNQEKYEMLKNQQIKGLFKILIQIYANQADIVGGEMPLHYFASLLLSQSQYSQNQQNNKNGVTNKLGLQFNLKKYEKNIKSMHLLNILKSNQNMVKKLFQILGNNFIKIANQKQFNNLFKLIRSQLRQINEHSAILKNNPNISQQQQQQQKQKIQTISPILPSISQSHNPNCILLGKYFTHLRQSYYSLQTLRKINPGQQLTIPIKQNMNNYDKLIRYGYKSIFDNPSNIDNFYPLFINLIDPQIQQVQQIIMNGDVQKKMKLLNHNDLKMKNIIRIQNNGKIKHQDMKMMRILYGIQNENQINSDNSRVDDKIYKFIRKFVEKSLQMHRNQYKNEDKNKGIQDPVIKSIRIIQADQINILESFMNSNKQK